MKHEIIYTEDYELIVSDEEIKEEVWFYSPYINQVQINCNPYGCKKVIAHRPLTDAPILQGVPLLPEFGESDNIEKLAYNWFVTADKKNTIFDLGWVNIFTAGYKKAKETYKYTEEDLRNAFNAGLMNRYSRVGEAVAEKEFIQSLQQPKRPKYFETVCDCQECGANKTNLSLDMGCENKMATTTNSQGQTELVGSYIF